ncbi:MAG TPA: 23S rRNA (pseudouridine(1915)-N(3))-methyltransferase RlmH [Halieaceae bacterium]|jgi:23S rRNA (pseudouridine1915-N3)-methyltransferase|nr:MULTISPECIES: 23S rRNA (pseudouridine(1915)-N(3))-methyltransferase RlmH [Haliea]HBM84836.1 23S rRNA (pseudouridine(1915)-N(3))-methyltransferase RlmH [Halieaceae bacterium]MAD64190.1 23S rRNA (pseudouridine(1915)-N(3))-methyltransferase RlmH [Haliea sp.]MAY94848.1 23S rRNA (pseudouridine(1915)-N(3))-methyltransferase RlmH [Haliea sp.]MBK39821.1 23S rRNA (pseudouridine(1915)-N(3))-methyltransferase RlmH [Haliea sp.]MBP69048.1 23S rRNA (pseudouridine(1915)-N(3))-methyltransferase RlmH [Halie|tara:strand:- start:1458 stop:1928 length:471 start_codon:yes stop_codon:yes gene_type:complete
MRLTVITVGGKMPAWVNEGVAEYGRRLPREIRLEWCELPLARRGRDTSPEQLRQREGELILKALPAGDTVIALDVRGTAWSTERLARELTDWQMDGTNVSLLIGGPDGLSEDCLQRARQRWSLSALTLPHPLVRVLLAEQVYRAWTITAGHPYHRA